MTSLEKIKGGNGTKNESGDPNICQPYGGFDAYSKMTFFSVGIPICHPLTILL